MKDTTILNATARLPPQRGRQFAARDRADNQANLDWEFLSIAARTLVTVAD